MGLELHVGGTVLRPRDEAFDQNRVLCPLHEKTNQIIECEKANKHLTLPEDMFLQQPLPIQSPPTNPRLTLSAPQLFPISLSFSQSKATYINQNKQDFNHSNRANGLSDKFPSSSTPSGYEL